VRSAKANSTTAAADSAYDMPGSEAAATKATTVETATTMEATTTEASSTTAVSGSPCCGTERHEGDAN